MHKVVISRKHGTKEVKSEVIVDKDGGPSITMDLDHFKAAVAEEMGSVLTVLTKAEAARRLYAAFDRVIMAMKDDSTQLAQHIK